MAPSETSAGAAEMGAPEASDALGYRRIVVPLDGSALAEQALPHAEALAQITGAPLHLVRVIDPTHLAPLAGVALRRDATALQLLLEDERIAAREYLERIERDLLARQQTVSVEYRRGPAARELLAVTQSGDLLIMSTHGLGGLARWFLGSVAEEVVRRATVPVWLVRVSDTEPTPFAIRRIVVPLDGSTLAEQALPQAEGLARLTGAPLHLVRVIDPAGLGTLGTVTLHTDALTMELLLEDERIAARDYLERVEQNVRERQQAVTVEYRQGPAAQELLAITQPGDLLVMATHGRSGLPRWFLGSVAEAVIRRASVPVLLVRATAPAPDMSAAEASE